MPEINYIKHLRENEDLSIAAIAKKLEIDWRMAKKYADGEVPLPPIVKKRRGMMYTEKYGQIVDIWLEEDMLEKKKQRRNNKKIFEQLRDEHGFPGSYRTVCEYIQHRKPELKLQQKRRHERLEHPEETWAPSGLIYHNGRLYTAGLRGEHIRAFDLEAESSDVVFEGLGRIRDLYVEEDGTLLVITSNRDGRGQPTAEDDRLLRFTFVADEE